MRRRLHVNFVSSGSFGLVAAGRPVSVPERDLGTHYAGFAWRAHLISLVRVRSCS